MNPLSGSAYVYTGPTKAPKEYLPTWQPRIAVAGKILLTDDVTHAYGILVYMQLSLLSVSHQTVVCSVLYSLYVERKDCMSS